MAIELLSLKVMGLIGEDERLWNLSILTELYLNRGKVYELIKEQQMAFNDYTEGMKISDKANVAGRYNDCCIARAKIYIMLEEYQKALDDFTKISEEEWQYGSSQIDEAYYYHALANFKLKNYQKAFKLINKALELNPKDNEAITLKSAIKLRGKIQEPYSSKTQEPQSSEKVTKRCPYCEGRGYIIRERRSNPPDRSTDGEWKCERMVKSYDGYWEWRTKCDYCGGTGLIEE